VCRLTLLLGPPGSGKTTLLLALAGRLAKDLKVLENGVCTIAFICNNYDFQNPICIRSITAFHENLLFSSYAKKWAAKIRNRVFFKKKKKIRNRAPLVGNCFNAVQITEMYSA